MLTCPHPTNRFASPRLVRLVLVPYLFTTDYHADTSRATRFKPCLKDSIKPWQLSHMAVCLAPFRYIALLTGHKKCSTLRNQFKGSDVLCFIGENPGFETSEPGFFLGMV